MWNVMVQDIIERDIMVQDIIEKRERGCLTLRAGQLLCVNLIRNGHGRR